MFPIAIYYEEKEEQSYFTNDFYKNSKILKDEELTKKFYWNFTNFSYIWTLKYLLNLFYFFKLIEFFFNPVINGHELQNSIQIMNLESYFGSPKCEK